MYDCQVEALQSCKSLPSSSAAIRREAALFAVAKATKAAVSSPQLSSDEKSDKSSESSSEEVPEPPKRAKSGSQKAK